jgi:hypothetical protein
LFVVRHRTIVFLLHSLLFPVRSIADSKALNGGQFPLSVLALQEHIASRYVVGTYGNTMTTNPRALDVAHSVLTNVTPDIRRCALRSGNRDEFLCP